MGLRIVSSRRIAFREIRHVGTLDFEHCMLSCTMSLTEERQLKSLLKSVPNEVVEILFFS